MAKAKTNSAAGNLDKGNAIVNNTNRKFDSDNLQDLLEDAASVLESISATGKKKAAITKLCGIFRSGDLKIAEQPTVTSDQGRITQVFNFGLDISDEEAQEISSYLTIGEGDEAEVYVAAEDVRDVSKLMEGIKRYVETTNNALLISGNISDSRARQIEELTERARTFDAELSNMREQYDSAERSFVNERNAKEEVEGKFKRYKRSSRIKTAIIAGVLGLALVGSGLFHYAGKEAKDRISGLESTFAEYGYSIDDAEYILGTHKNAHDQLVEVNKELGEIGEIVGADPSGDLSSAVQGALDNANKTETDPEIDEIKGALGDRYEEGADLSDTVAGIVGDLDAAEAELDEIENILTENNQTVVDGDVSQALSDFIAGLENSGTVVPEDGVHQSHVDAVYNAIAESLASLGITEESLKDENGNYTTEKLTSAIATIVEDAVENKAIVENVSGKLEAVLNGIYNLEEERPYTLSDFETYDDAFDKISDHIKTLGDTTLSLVEDVAELTEQVQSLTEELEDLKEDYKEALLTLEELKEQVSELEAENKTLEEENKTLEDKVGELENEKGNQTNPDQGESGKDSTENSNENVSDSEVNENDNPNQSDGGSLNPDDEELGNENF